MIAITFKYFTHTHGIVRFRTLFVYVPPRPKCIINNWKTQPISCMLYVCIFYRSTRSTSKDDSGKKGTCDLHLEGPNRIYLEGKIGAESRCVVKYVLPYLKNYNRWEMRNQSKLIRKDHNQKCE